MPRTPTETAQVSKNLLVYLGGSNEVHVASTFDIERSDGKPGGSENCDQLLDQAVTDGILTAAQRTAFVNGCVAIRGWLRTKLNLQP